MNSKSLDSECCGKSFDAVAIFQMSYFTQQQAQAGPTVVVVQQPQPIYTPALPEKYLRDSLKTRTLVCGIIQVICGVLTIILSTCLLYTSPSPRD